MEDGQDMEIHERLRGLVDEEHALRDRLSQGEITPEQEQTRLSEIEVLKDQSWDLLRQREALREAGADPDEARMRPADEVEGYLQ